MAKSGWFKESARHSLAAKGVPTGRKAYVPTPKQSSIDLAVEVGGFKALDLDVYHPEFGYLGARVAKDSDMDAIEGEEEGDAADREAPNRDLADEFYFYMDDNEFEGIRQGKIGVGSIIELDEPMLLIGAGGDSLKIDTDDDKAMKKAWIEQMMKSPERSKLYAKEITEWKK